MAVELTVPTCIAISKIAKPTRTIRSSDRNAAMYDLEKVRRHPSVNLDPRIKCVIVYAFQTDDGLQVIGEGIEDWNLAGWRWVQYEDSIRDTESPDDENVIHWHDEYKKFSHARYEHQYFDWQDMRDLLARTGAQVAWFYDHSAANFHKWDL